MKRTLIIEDNDNNMELITYILRNSGYETLRAYTGMDGVRMAIEEQPDMVILDIQLPDIEGTEVIKRIRAHKCGRTVPVVAMTSYAMAGDREKLLASGCNAYIEKPIDPERVVAQIEAVYRKSVT